MSRAFLTVCMISAFAVAACQGEDATMPPSPPGCFVGDPAASPALTLVFQSADGALAPVVEGGVLPLIVPPQGGQVLVIGVRALNVDGCPLTLSTSLSLPTGVVAAFDRRPVTLRPAADGWLEPMNPVGLANFANLPACPIAGLAQSIDGESYRLTVEVEDRAGRRGGATTMIVPTCDASSAPEACRCLCAAGYVLGSPC